jgi:hypothetical protein
MSTTPKTEPRRIGVQLNGKHYTVFVDDDGSVIRISTCSAARFMNVDTTGRTGRAVLAKMRAITA